MTRSESSMLDAAASDAAAAQRRDEGQQPAMSRRELREREAQQARVSTRRVLASRVVAPRLVVPHVAAPRVVAPRASGSDVHSVVPRVPVAASAPTTSVGVRPPRRRSRANGLVRTLMSVGAMVGVTAMLISTSIPGSAFGTGDPAEASQVLAEERSASASAGVQSLGIVTAAEGAVVQPVRDTYTAKAYVAPVVVKKVQRFSGPVPGNASYAYAANPTGAVQWPFPSTSPISYGFGPRSACSYCSSFHNGIDFTPGAGVPVHSIAGGTVITTSVGAGGYGNHVVIEHNVNGQRVRSLYAHLAWGSIQVAVGQQVSPGTIVGAVGSTGNSTGAHLHLEVHVDGRPIDGFAWLKANAG